MGEEHGGGKAVLSQRTISIDSRMLNGIHLGKSGEKYVGSGVSKRRIKSVEQAYVYKANLYELVLLVRILTSYLL